MQAGRRIPDEFTPSTTDENLASHSGRGSSSYQPGSVLTGEGGGGGGCAVAEAGVAANLASCAVHSRASLRPTGGSRSDKGTITLPIATGLPTVLSHMTVMFTLPVTSCTWKVNVLTCHCGSSLCTISVCRDTPSFLTTAKARDVLFMSRLDARPLPLMTPTSSTATLPQLGDDSPSTASAEPERLLPP